MVKWIKRKDGTFAGSIGDGKAQVPTKIQARPAVPISNAVTIPEQDHSLSRILASQDPESAYFEALSRTQHNDRSSLELLKVRARTLAGTPGGKVQVLTDALSAAENHELQRANTLIDAAQDVDPTLKGPSNVGFERAVEDIAIFRKRATTPVMVPPAGKQAGKTYPFDGFGAAKALRRVAEHVLEAEEEFGLGFGRNNYPYKTEVYSPELINSAREFKDVGYCSPSAAEPHQVSAAYTQFVAKVDKAQRANAHLVSARAKYLLGLANSRNYATSQDPWA